MNKKTGFMRGRGAGSSNLSPKKKKGVLDAAIIVLSVILALSILFTINSFRESTSIYYDTESGLYSYLTSGEYATLGERWRENGIGFESDPQVRKISDYYAVGEYFEKAFFANAYEKAGNSEKASALREQLTDTEQRMGQFAAEKENILRLLK